MKFTPTNYFTESEYKPSIEILSRYRLPNGYPVQPYWVWN